MQIFYVAPIRQDVGLTSAALGLVRAMQRLGYSVGFIKPVGQDESGVERSVHFSREICHQDVSDPMPLEAVEARIAQDEFDDLLEDIVGTVMKAAEKVDVLVVEGLHLDPKYSFIYHLNAGIARSLRAEVILVADASIPTVIADANTAINLRLSEGRKVAGFVFNKAPLDFDIERARRELIGAKLWNVIPNDPRLLMPRTLDVAKQLKAGILEAGDIHTRRVAETIIAARSVPEVIHRFKPGALIVCPVDRNDIILAVALAAINGVPLAGLLLTHSDKVQPHIRAFISSAFESGLPLLYTEKDSYDTARAISRMPNSVPMDDLERMNLVINVVADHFDDDIINAAVKVERSPQLSPPAFRYTLLQKSRMAKHNRIVLPEGDEPRTIRAAAICAEKGIAHCILLGNPDRIHSVAATQGVTLPAGVEILDPENIRNRYVDPMLELRKGKGLTAPQAQVYLEDNVVVGTMMLALDEVDGLVSGAVHTTANTVRPALQLIKTAPGSTVVSSVFFMLMPDQVMVYGDCAINPDPTAEQLAEIAKQSAESARAFGIDPKIAMLSYSTGTSGAGADVEKVRLATEIAQQRWPELVIDGPMQFDAATVAEVGKQKAPDSLVAGQATVMIFPDLNTGNTTYKAVQRSAKVVSIGPMLQGLRKPVNDLSRGALVDDIVFTIAITVIQAQTQAER